MGVPLAVHTMKKLGRAFLPAVKAGGHSLFLLDKAILTKKNSNFLRVGAQSLTVHRISS